MTELYAPWCVITVSDKHVLFGNAMFEKEGGEVIGEGMVARRGLMVSTRVVEGPTGSDGALVVTVDGASDSFSAIVCKVWSLQPSAARSSPPAPLSIYAWRISASVSRRICNSCASRTFTDCCAVREF